MDSSTQQPRKVSRSRFVLAAGIDLALLFLIFVWPGWELLSFFNDRTSDVLGLVALWLVVDLVANLTAAASDTDWLRSAAEFAAAMLTVITLGWILAIFPFDFTGLAVDWTTAIRVLLIVGMVGAAIGAVAHGIRLRRYLAERGYASGRGWPDHR